MKTITLQAAFIISLSIASISCQSHSVQITSGKEYLSNYSDYDASEMNASDLNEEVKLIANDEPSIKFPSRIGLVKFSMAESETYHPMKWRHGKMQDARWAQNLVNSFQ